MKIYTKKGDLGETSLIGGTRVTKDHIRIDAYGTVDELNSWVGLLRVDAKQADMVELLKGIQTHLFNIGSHLAEDKEKSKMELPILEEARIEDLEQMIDQLDSELPALTSFVLPGGSTRSANAHIARTTCRRGERTVVHLSAQLEVDDHIIKYLNRLSDFLFILARKWEMEDGHEALEWRP